MERKQKNKEVTRGKARNMFGKDQIDHLEEAARAEGKNRWPLPAFWP